jgi:hypothetical protein
MESVEAIREAEGDPEVPSVVAISLVLANPATLIENRKIPLQIWITVPLIEETAAENFLIPSPPRPGIPTFFHRTHGRTFYGFSPKDYALL